MRLLVCQSVRPLLAQLQTDAFSNQSQAACQALAALVLANLHASDRRRTSSMSELQDSH